MKNFKNIKSRSKFLVLTALAAIPVSAFLLAIVSIVGASRAEGQELGRLEGLYRIQHSQLVGIRVGEAKYRFESGVTRLQGQASLGTGVFGESKNQVNETFTKAPSKAIVGDLSLQFQLDEREQPIAALTIQLNERHQGYLVRAGTTIQLPVKFIEGSWKEFVLGKTVRVEALPSGGPIFERSMAKWFTDLVMNALTTSTDTDRVVFTIKPRLIGPIRMTLNKEKVLVEEILTDYQIVLSLPM